MTQPKWFWEINIPCILYWYILQQWIVTFWVLWLATGYLVLVFTKSANSNFRVFWLAPEIRNILGYSLFFQKFSQRQNLSDKWNIRTNNKIPRKRRTLASRCLLVSRKLFSCWICNKIIKMHFTKSQNVCTLLTKFLLSDVYNLKKYTMIHI